MVGLQILKDLGLLEGPDSDEQPQEDRSLRAVGSISRWSARFRSSRPSNPHRDRYMETKRQKMGHLLPPPPVRLRAVPEDPPARNRRLGDLAAPGPPSLDDRDRPVICHRVHRHVCPPERCRPPSTGSCCSSVRGALFVGIPAVVIGLFQSPRVAMAGAGYAVPGTLSALSARSLHRRLNVRFGIVVVLVFLAVMALRFAFYPVQLPLALIRRSSRRPLAFVSLLQLTSLLRLHLRRSLLP